MAPLKKLLFGDMNSEFPYRGGELQGIITQKMHFFYENLLFSFFVSSIQSDLVSKSISHIQSHFTCPLLKIVDFIGPAFDSELHLKN